MLAFERDCVYRVNTHTIGRVPKMRLVQAASVMLLQIFATFTWLRSTIPDRKAFQCGRERHLPGDSAIDSLEEEREQVCAQLFGTINFRSFLRSKVIQLNFQLNYFQFTVK